MARLGAGIRVRKDGTFEKRFTIEGKQYSVYGKTTKEILAKELEKRKQIETGAYTKNRNITLDKYFEEWIEGKRGTTKSNSLRLYSSYYKLHISPAIGKRKIQQIERREITKLQSDLQDKLAIRTVNNIFKTLNIILNDARIDDIISKNPAEGVKPLKEAVKASETYHRALTVEEQKAFMQEIESDYYYEYVALLLCTGMRTGEAAALTWNDIDYKNNVIHISKTLTCTEKGAPCIGDTPKSEAGKRDIPLNNTIKNVLAKQKAKMGNIYSITNRSVFISVFGGIVQNHAINSAIENALARLEAKGTHIERFTAHALRDTFATRYIEQGGTPQTLKTILGHSSLSMTMDLYAHVLPNTKQSEMDKLYIAL